LLETEDSFDRATIDAAIFVEVTGKERLDLVRPSGAGDALAVV
jgi:hypothetical protein